jgi:hypothetical protein
LQDSKECCCSAAVGWGACCFPLLLLLRFTLKYRPSMGRSASHAFYKKKIVALLSPKHSFFCSHLFKLPKTFGV